MQQVILVDECAIVPTFKFNLTSN